MDVIRLKGLRFEVFIGHTEVEGRRSQPVELDLELHGDFAAAGRSDRLEDTVDYAAVFDAVKASLEGQRVHLLEAAAERAAQAALRAGAREVVVRARKFNPPVKGVLPVSEVEVRRRA